MTQYVALLRGINVGGHKPVAMAALRDFATRLGFVDARTLLQSGNLLFRGEKRSTAGLERLLEEEAARRLMLEAGFFVRTAAELRAVVDGNPFADEARRDPGRLLVVFLKSTPTAAGVAALRAAITGREVLRVAGRHAYVVYPDGVGRSRLTSSVLEKKLGTRGTGRNWNTALKLEALCGNA